MLTKKQLLKSLFIFSNYGDGTRTASGETIILFYLFYNNTCLYSELRKLLPTKDERTIRRYTQSIEYRGFIENFKVRSDDGKQIKAVRITDKGSAYCLKWLEATDTFLQNASSKNAACYPDEKNIE